MSKSNYPTVSQLVGQVKRQLEGEFRTVHVQGEVSNITMSSTGHWYFTLIDKDANLSIALFKMDAYKNPYIKKVKNGDQVLLTGGIGVYAKRGTFQLIAKSITPIGLGDLNVEFEKLKAKLSKEGLFDVSIKKSIPTIPRKIAVITGENSAAWADFKNVFMRRSIMGQLILVPALVQGDSAPQSIIKSLNKIKKYQQQLLVNEEDPIDTVVICRGGGSIEDLWCFNNEALAREIFQFEIPVVSGVGHEVDFTICDFVSDLRVETPTASAEVLTQNQNKLKNKFIFLIKSLTSDISILLSDFKEKLTDLSPQNQVRMITDRFSRLRQRLTRISLEHRSQELLNTHEFQLRLDDSFRELISYKKNMSELYTNKLQRMNELLMALNPENILERGYSYVKSENGLVITKIKDFNKVSTGTKLSITFKDGSGKVSKL